jgi:molybdopterin/thiamine biosynthesis adenylyltransferase
MASFCKTMTQFFESKPSILSENEARDLQNNNPYIFEVDAFSRQLKELFFIDNHPFIGVNKEEVYASTDFKQYTELKKNDFVYIYYAWSHHLVKSVSNEDYFKLKTNRNQDLITSEEQVILKNYKVAVLGMSVGSNIAFVLTQAGISDTIVLADFDELDTTNLNRILAGVHQIGLNKTIVAARKIYEDNPFANVVLWQEGVTKTNLEQALKNGEINCLIEEIDDIPLKIEIRLLAMKYKVPVVMVTDNGDGIVIHVERYDLGNTKIWGRDFSYYEEKIKGPKSKELSGEIIINDIVGGVHRVDPKMIASVNKVLKKELVSWSQLGSAAILGAVMCTYMIKEIALGKSDQLDIRSYITPTTIDHKTHTS